MKSQLFFSTVVVILGLVVSSCSGLGKKKYSPKEIKEESARINQFFDDNFDKNVKKYPMFITHIGGRERYGELNDISYAFSKKQNEESKKYLEQLKAFNYEALDTQARLSYDLFKQRTLKGLENFKYYYHGYIVSQMFGHHTRLPSFMINMHQVANEKEAKDYISRLNAFEGNFQQLLVLLKKQESLGIKMPNFSFDKVIEESNNIISGYPFQRVKTKSSLYQDFLIKVKKLKLPREKERQLLKQAEKALLTSVKKGYSTFISHMSALKLRSPKSEGVWALPDGKEYYNSRLETQTTTKLTAPEIHEIGLGEVKRIHNEMRQIMKKVGFKGSLQEFFKFMKTDKQFYFPNTKKGRESYLKEAKGIIAGMRVKLDELFIVKPKAELVVKPVEAFREKSAAVAFYQGPALNGSRPGIYYINLYDMKSISKYEMEALAYHEAIPGHHMQISIAREIKGIPKFRLFGGYTAYSEGWGLYAEYIPKELGFYKDPYSDFGRLSLEVWRATRLVVDTGIHHYKWSREKAIQYFAENIPSSEKQNIKEVERYFVMPGQATSYKIGQLKILELRNKAKKKLGDRFNIREFHNEVLGYGAIPLDALEKKIGDYIKAKSLPIAKK